MKQVANTSNIIKFTRPEPPTWMQQATRLYNEGRDEFRQVCHVARLGAQQLSFPRDNSFFALIDNMELLKNSSWELNYAIEQIKEIYNEVYPPAIQADDSCLAEIIPFPMEVAQ